MLFLGTIIWKALTLHLEHHLGPCLLTIKTCLEPQNIFEPYYEGTQLKKSKLADLTI